MIDSITRSELILSFVDERHRLRIRERKMAGFSTRKPTLPLRILTYFSRRRTYQGWNFTKSPRVFRTHLARSGNPNGG